MTPPCEMAYRGERERACKFNIRARDARYMRAFLSPERGDKLKNERESFLSNYLIAPPVAVSSYRKPRWDEGTAPLQLEAGNLNPCHLIGFRYNDSLPIHLFPSLSLQNYVSTSVIWTGVSCDSPISNAL